MFRVFLIITIVFLHITAFEAVVVDEDGKPLKDVEVKFAKLDTILYSDSEGKVLYDEGIPITSLNKGLGIHSFLIKNDNIIISLGTPGKVKLSIYNIQGKSVFSINKLMSPGIHAITTKDFAKGIYILKGQIGSEHFLYKICSSESLKMTLKNSVFQKDIRQSSLTGDTAFFEYDKAIGFSYLKSLRNFSSYDENIGEVIMYKAKGKIIPDSLFGSGISIKKTQDDNLLLLASKRSGYYEGVAPWILKVNMEGEIIWEKTFSQLDNQGLIKTCLNGELRKLHLRDDNIICTGEKYKAFYCASFDNSGNFISDLTFTKDSVDYDNSIPLSNGDFVLFGKKTYEAKSLGYYDKLYVTKIDSNGVEKWTKYLFSSDSYNASSVKVNDIKIAYDSTIVFVGETDSAYVCKIDTAGNIKMIYRVPHTSSMGDESSLRCVSLTADSGFYCTGNYEAVLIGGDRQNNVLTIKLDKYGNVDWDTHAGTDAYSENAYSGAFEINENHYIAFVTYFYNGENIISAWNEDPDESGTTSKSISPYDNRNVMRESLIANDSIIIGIGNASSSKEDDNLWLIKYNYKYKNFVW